EVQRGCWQLTRAPIKMPAGRSVLTEDEAADVLPALEQTSEGRSFLADLRAYLNEYGRRFNTFGGISEPSWVEVPTPAIACLKAYATRPNTPPEAEQAWLVAERERVVAEARAKLAGYPQPVVARFETLLTAALCGAGIKENSHWAITPGFFQMRRLGLAFRRRLTAAGVLGT